MDLVGNPIPSRPAAFAPTGAPPGVAIDFEAFRRHGETEGAWFRARPKIRPTTLVVHTNAAGVEGSLSSQVNWANSSKNNTHAHYNVNAPQPTKHCPTDRRGIGNSTGADLRRSAGVKDSSFWSIVIETADMGRARAQAKGINWGPDCGPFIHDHAEIVARILAYESIVWNIPLAYPARWTESGTVSHTDPFPFPHFTTREGKTCPGSTKKHQLRHEILPRANEIRAAWVGDQRTGDFTGSTTHDGIHPLAPDPVEVSLLAVTVKTSRALRNGDSGRDVKVMQHLLAAAGYLDEGNPKNYDGDWQTGTDAAKERFDLDHGLHSPGDTSCGPRSWESLLTNRIW